MHVKVFAQTFFLFLQRYTAIRRRRRRQAGQFEVAIRLMGQIHFDGMRGAGQLGTEGRAAIT